MHQDTDLVGASIVSVNVAEPAPLVTRHGPTTSAIGKRPVAGRVMVRRLNLDGDRQADLSVHGGPDKAVYCYAAEHYGPWAAELERAALPWGTFGENLTTRGLLETEVRLGDVLRAGSALLEVSQPRSPCFKLAAVIGVRGFERAFLHSGRTGWYARVLEEGDVGPGDAIERVTRGDGPTVWEAVRQAYGI